MIIPVGETATGGLVTQRNLLYLLFSAVKHETGGLR